MDEERRLPAPGDRLTHRLRKGAEPVVAEVVSVDRATGKIVVQVGDVLYTSLSAAAEAVCGHAVNGWVFWGLKGQPPRRRHVEEGTE